MIDCVNRKGEEKKDKSEERKVNVIRTSGGDRGFLCAVNEVIWLVMRKVTDPSLNSTRLPSVSAFLPLS